ncbi:NUDIX domain-containing protein [Segetibacter sp. 3557_3]|uniref:NUDIX hydrolase n=1 Tax=Segetibacter sp. 3557_3 TaxID=2547429 RepID=UPI0010585A5F|nr:NUDIX hydrolase [Segetibacter sp. 3557_3]TDH25638.1 NUDIX domain-containing protein [Segetibacter sp. 3557_3]
MEIPLLEEIKKTRSIAEVGLLYCGNEFDRERYLELKAISMRMMSAVTGKPVETLEQVFSIVDDYPTAKVDVRALILSPDKKILLVKEGVDQKWTLPGGWADIGYTPKETAIKECIEETGLDVIPTRLLAVFDKRMHPHPPQPHYVYKLIFLCEPTSSQLSAGFDMLDVAYFDIDDLPELSRDRIIESQLKLVYHKAIDGDREAYFE